MALIDQQIRNLGKAVYDPNHPLSKALDKLQPIKLAKLMGKRPANPLRWPPSASK